MKLAKKLNGEIISADSRQVYRGLDIGSGKVSGTWRAGHPERSEGSHAYRRGEILQQKLQNDKNKVFIYKSVPHYCIDFVSPKKTFTVAEFKKCAEAAISEIAGRGKIPILAGGTGFWVDAVAYDLNIPEVPPNPKLRRELEKKDATALLKILQKLDPRRAKTIEQKNPRRLIRAIEIAKALGRVPKLARRSPYHILWIGLSQSYETRSHKIETRVEKMVRQGLILEAKKLLRQGVGRKRIKEFGFEYRLTLEFVDGKLSKKELKERLLQETLAYARRQMTWWKRNADIHWISSPLHLNGTNIRRTLASFLASKSHMSKS